MKWTIARIDDADFGCEERLPGEPLMVLVSLESEDFRVTQFEVAEDWITLQKLSEGDEWPEDLDLPDDEAQKSIKQSEWMENYIKALEEIK